MGRLLFQEFIHFGVLPRSVPYGQATHSETSKNDEESSENDEAGLETGENKAL